MKTKTLKTNSSPLYHCLSYTKEENEFIALHYSTGDYTIEEIAVALKRKPSAVKEHIGRLGITRKIWTEERDMYLYKHSRSQSFEGIALRLGLSKGQVVRRYYSDQYKQFLAERGLQYTPKRFKRRSAILDND